MNNVAQLFEIKPQYSAEDLRVAEALIFAAPEPLDEKDIAGRLSNGADVSAVLAALSQTYQSRGVNLVRLAGKWTFRTAADLTWLLAKEERQTRKLSRAAIETLAIVAYHQPVTRADIEDIRGVAVSKGALDILLEAGWVRMRGRRKAPGRPITYGTTAEFLIHFNLDAVGDLPGLEELAGAGLFEGKLPPGFGVPMPDDAIGLRADEDPLEDVSPLELAWSAPQDEDDADPSATKEPQ